MKKGLGLLLGAVAAAYSDAETTTTATPIMGDAAAKVHAKKGLGEGICTCCT